MIHAHFVYVKETSKSFKEAVVAVRKVTEAAKWGILGGYDFAEILNSKGFPQTEEMKTLEICAPAHANGMIGIEKLTALCMPCSVLIFTEKGKTKIAAMRPGAILPSLFPSHAPQFEKPAAAIDDEVKAIIDKAAGD
ncbi:DUF302 domain-containing protein [Candidatus Acetothermia bacterium]|nr:DUF302 domain-containing protein [Candidatus Acetothermia bacterium]MBI3643466.1 DUF302 domain-containing protein [Candidatus Acetothermia bacterium]